MSMQQAVRAPLALLTLAGPTDFVSRASALGVDVSAPMRSGGLVADVGSYVVSLDGREVSLSPRQVELLVLFLAAPSRVWSRGQLNWACWADSSASRRVDVQLCRMRARTGLDLFRNVRDRGWSLRPVS
jgi:DNA-binding response OmpR family regulator